METMGGAFHISPQAEPVGLAFSVDLLNSVYKSYAKMSSQMTMHLT
jgi:hypothetical protein